MTTRVYVVYVFDKHIHAFKLLIISVYKCVFGGRVYVWRLILKKIYYTVKKQIFTSPEWTTYYRVVRDATIEDLLFISPVWAT